MSFNNIGGIFTVGTAPEHRRKRSSHGTFAKGSDAERLYISLGFQVAYTHRRYELQLQKQ
ncbi:MAG: hypothetical protein QW667_00125 [Candidatus Bathyarchaeia archaeon]